MLVMNTDWASAAAQVRGSVPQRIWTPHPKYLSPRENQLGRNASRFHGAGRRLSHRPCPLVGAVEQHSDDGIELYVEQTSDQHCWVQSSSKHDKPASVATI